MRQAAYDKECEAACTSTYHVAVLFRLVLASAEVFDLDQLLVARFAVLASMFAVWEARGGADCFGGRDVESRDERERRVKDAAVAW
eukprot:5761946-Pleurochrysis_carterae.AAC.1